MRTMERINKLTYLLPLLLAFLVIADHMPVEATHPDHVQIPASPRATHPDHVQIPASPKATHLDHVQLPASPKATYSDHDNVKGSCTPGSTHTKCSRPVTGDTKATLTLNSFQKGGSGGGPSECDGQYHSDDTLIVALSTGWYNNGARCFKFININGNGRSVRAMVVDECDTNRGCKNNIVDGSKAVWMALGVSPSDGKWGMMGVTWSDA